MTDSPETIEQQRTIADFTSGWTQAVSFAQFDPSLGTLTGVRVALTGNVTGIADIENLGVTASTVSLALPSVIDVQGPNGLSASASPDPAHTVNLGAFDGAADFGGTSGAVVAGFSDTQTAVGTLALGADLSDFVGAGTVALAARSSSSADETGGGNLLSRMLASAGAKITLDYEYVPNTPDNGGSDAGDVTYNFVIDVNDVSLLAGPFANAVTAEAQSFTTADSTTGWRTSLPVAKFDPSLGTLDAVDIKLTGDIAASVAAENLGDTAMTFSASQAAAITIALTNDTTFSASPYAMDSMTLAAFDGNADFAGTSGHTDNNITNPYSGFTTASGEDQVTDYGVLTAFTGTGTYDLPISSTGTSVTHGQAGLLSELTQKSGAAVTVAYIYTPVGSEGSETLPCFAAGTSIATEQGSVPVEALSVGCQRVTLASGGTAPIRWIGHRHIDCTRHPKPEAVWPVRVCAGAIADSEPARDLLLSPDHAIYVDGVLIPIRRLINETTIVQEPRDSVQYFHIELDRHDILLAEGLPVESFLDTGNRNQFSNGGRIVQLHPSFAALTWDAKACAPLVVTGQVFARVKRKLDRRARRSCRSAADEPAAGSAVKRPAIPGAARVARRQQAARAIPGGSQT